MVPATGREERTSQQVEEGSSARVLYVQYTNPAAYPPIEHGALLLAEAGADVLLAGSALLDGAVRFATHPRIRVRLHPSTASGWRLKWQYLRYAFWVLGLARRFRPTWVYASDPISAPVALLLKSLLRVPVIYHEHDSPAPAHLEAQTGMFRRIVAGSRRLLASRAALCILPSADRAAVFTEETGRQDPLTLWNVPLLREADAGRKLPHEGLRLLYQGSIVPARVPETLFRALARMPRNISLSIAGYDPSGGVHLESLRALTRDLGIRDRVHFVGTVPTRDELLRRCAANDVGISLVPLVSSSFNEQTMMGASNKPFDYLASGLAVLVPDLPDWKAAFVDSGYGLACDPASVDSVVAALEWFASHPDDVRRMGAAGRRRVIEEWNYDSAFAPVVERILGAHGVASHDDPDAMKSHGLEPDAGGR